MSILNALEAALIVLIFLGTFLISVAAIGAVVKAIKEDF